MLPWMKDLFIAQRSSWPQEISALGLVPHLPGSEQGLIHLFLQFPIVIQLPPLQGIQPPLLFFFLPCWKAHFWIKFWQWGRLQVAVFICEERRFHLESDQGGGTSPLLMLICMLVFNSEFLGWVQRTTGRCQDGSKTLRKLIKKITASVSLPQSAAVSREAITFSGILLKKGLFSASPPLPPSEWFHFRC